MLTFPSADVTVSVFWLVVSGSVYTPSTAVCSTVPSLTEAPSEIVKVSVFSVTSFGTTIQYVYFPPSNAPGYQSPESVVAVRICAFSADTSVLSAITVYSLGSQSKKPSFSDFTLFA